MRFRIGIHVGEALIEGENLYGDAVNIAARLQEIAAASGICATGGVVEHIREDRRRDREPGRAIAEERCRARARLPVELGREAIRCDEYRRSHAGFAGEAIHSRSAFCEYQRRSGAGIFQRRDHGGHHHCLVEAPVVFRGRWELLLCLQGKASDVRQLPGTRLCDMCSKGACARPVIGCASQAS